MVLLPVEEVGTFEMVTVAAAAVVAVGGVSGSKVMADPADHDLGVAGLEEVDLLVVVVVVVVALAAAAAAAGFAAVVAALVQWVVDSQAGSEDPADLEEPDPAAVEPAAGERRKVVVLAETVGAGCRKVDLEEGHGDLGTVDTAPLVGHVGQEVEKGGPAGGKEAQSCPVVGRGMEAAAGRSEVVGRADCSSPDSAGCSPLGPVVHRPTSRHNNSNISLDQP